MRYEVRVITPDEFRRSVWASANRYAEKCAEVESLVEQRDEAVALLRELFAVAAAVRTGIPDGFPESAEMQRRLDDDFEETMGKTDAFLSALDKEEQG